MLVESQSEKSHLKSKDDLNTMKKQVAELFDKYTQVEDTDDDATKAKKIVVEKTYERRK